MDVKTAFLNEDLKEEIYVHQPLGFEVMGQKHNTCYMGSNKHLVHDIASYISFCCPKALSIHIHSPNLYVLQENSDLLILVLYVDDILLTSSDIAAVKSALCQIFDMTHLGLLYYCLGIEFCQT